MLVCNEIYPVNPVSKEFSGSDDANKSRDQLIRELAEIRIRLAAQTQECIQLRSLQEQQSSSGPKVHQTEEIIQDIAEREKFAHALREAEQRYRTLFNTMDEAFVLKEMISDEAGVIDFLFVDVNPAFEKHSGLHDVMGKTMRQALPCTAPKLIEKYAKIIRTGEQMRFEDHVADLDRWFDFFAWRVGEAENRRVAMLFTDITARKHSENALREYRAKLEAALASMTDAVCISDDEGRFFEFNDAFATFHKFKDKKECLKKLSEYPDILDVFMADGEPAPLDRWAVSRALRGEKATSAEYTLRRKDTGETWVGSYSFGPIRDEKRVIVGSVVVGRDITEQKRSEQALLDSESFYRQTLESIPGMVFTTRPDGYCDYQSQQWVEYTGIPLIEHLGNGWNKLLHPEDQPQAMAAWRNAVEGNAPYNLEYRVRRYDGAYEWFQVIGRPIRDDDGNIVRWFGVAMNMEEHKKAEQALLAHSARLGLLATVAERLLRAEDPQVIIRDLCKLVLTHLNLDFFLNYLAKPPEQKLHLNAYAGILREAVDEIHDFDFGTAVCGSVASRGERVIAENIQNSEDPRTQLLKSYGVQAYCCHPLMTQEKLIGTLSFGTLARQAFTEDELALMKSVSDQVAVAIQRMETEKAIHDLNQTLKQQVTERTALAEGRARQLQALAVELIEAEEKERQRISLLLHEDFQQLLASAKMQLQAACETMPPNTFIVNVEHLLAECIVKSRRLSQDLSPPILQNAGIVQSLEWLIAKMRDQFGLFVDIKAQDVGCSENNELKVFLFQAVKELLFNVAQHSGAKKANLDFCRSHKGLVLTVSDQGKGFDPTILDGVKNATGLGLASLRERVSYIGGELVIKSSPGKGCRLTLKLPFGTATEESLQAVVPPPMLSERKDKEKKIKVIIADDHKVMRQGLVKMISCQPDIQVIGEAAGGFEAIELARRLKPDMILMDISMPGVDGIEATRIVKAEMPEIRVIGLSMFEDDQMEQKMLQVGAEAFISKASSIHEMLKAIYKFGYST
jgi:PAS domain S-box-containing protein